MPANYDEVFGRDEHVESNASRLLRLAKDELHGEERLLFEEHLKTCPACRLELLQMQEAVDQEHKLWERGRAVVKEFIAARIPEHGRFVESVWALMEIRGVLGVLPDLGTPQAQPAVGLLPPAADRRLPAIVAVLSHVLAGVISSGLRPADAVEQDRQEAETVLREVAQLDAAQVSMLDDFAAALRSAGLGRNTASS